MLSTIYLLTSLLAGGVLLTLLSKFFADEVSRALEATFDFIEIGLAARARDNAERLAMRQSGEGRRFGETQFGIPAERSSAA